MPVAVVTDSTAYLAESVGDRHGVRVVPLQVTVDGTSYDEGSPGPDISAALRRGQRVTTSRPSPSRLLEAYVDAAESGADAVVSVHLSADMSGTHAAAMLAAVDAPVPVHVVDSRTLGMGLGYAALSAAAAARAGCPAEEVAAVARARAAASASYFYVDTLEYLRRGGRIGAARAFLGSALAVKPLLHLVDGHIEPLEKVRTSGRAVARLVELAVSRADDAEVDLAVHHLDAADRAAEVAAALRERVSHLAELHVSEVGAVVGAHVGPGLLAVVVSPRAAVRLVDHA